MPSQAEMPRRPPDSVREAVPLSRYTTMRVGGPARYLAHIASAESVRLLVSWAQDEGVAWVILGEGSNVVCADSGYHGLVIVYQDPTAEPAFAASGCGAEEALLTVEASMPLSSLARWAARRGLSGLEWAAGIPGTVGGALLGNAGAFGASMADVVVEAEVLRPGGAAHESAATLGLAYRTSALALDAGPVAVLNVALRLHGDEPSACLSRLEEATLARRRSQPGGPSSGCVFRNPAGASAGQLLDRCGLKGRSIGDAVYSEKHANFVVNRGRATAADVVGLMQLGREMVWRQFGVMLEPEVRFLGGLALEVTE